MEQLINKVQTELAKELGDEWHVIIYEAEHISFQFKCYHVSGKEVLTPFFDSISPIDIDQTASLVKTYLL